MLEALRAWLNGTREYSLGVSLYNKLGDNEELKRLLKSGHTAYNHTRVQKELMAICIELKSQHETDEPQEEQQGKKAATIFYKQNYQATAKPSPAAENANPALYDACKLAADKVYKEAMNTRAVLFSMVPSELCEDPNRPDLVTARSDKSIQVVKLFNQASKLYDQADYVRIHGQLPGGSTEADTDEDEDGEDSVPDHLVKNTLDNKRKNLNKIKKRPPTPDRVALIQTHEAEIKKLEVRWHSLK